MGKRDFDNLLRVIHVDLDNILNVRQSVEIDFEIPRGFIAKIKKIDMFHNGFISAVGNIDLLAVVIRDPDDALTTVMPENTTQHDVLGSLTFSIQGGTGTTGSTTDTSGRDRFEKTYDQGEDLVTARNMRFNAIGSSGSISLGTIACEIFFTWEKVNDADILELLDIL